MMGKALAAPSLIWGGAGSGLFIKMRRGNATIEGHAIRRHTSVDANMLLTEKGERMCGLGVVLQKQEVNQGYGYVTVKRLVKNGPAEKAGLMEGDFVMTIDGVDLRSIPEDHLPALVVGAQDSEIRMVSNRGGTSLRAVAMKRTLEIARVQHVDKLTSVVLVLSRGPESLTASHIQR
jgi:C-terminal processing protease CtpA/Prc